MQRRAPLTWVELSRDALRHNVAVLKKRIGASRILAVVKANAYGHGLIQVVKMLNNDATVSGYAVASLDEAMTLSSQTRKPIIVLSMWQRDPHLIALAAKKGIIVPLYESRQALWLQRQSVRLHRPIRVHLKINIGTHRIGFRDDDIAGIVRAARRKGLAIEGVFGHFADSEIDATGFTSEQMRRFENVCGVLEKHGIPVGMRHVACTAAAIREKRFRADAVRVGIGLYGLWPSDEVRDAFRSLALRPVLSWKTTVLQVQIVRAGETVGYDRTYRARRRIKLAVLAAGYADGYDRGLSNKGSVLIRGVRCPVRGRVCMNLTMVEVPERCAVRTGDTAELITSSKNGISADELARLCDTINYEIVTRISPLLPRVVTF